MEKVKQGKSCNQEYFYVLIDYFYVLIDYFLVEVDSHDIQWGIFVKILVNSHFLSSDLSLFFVQIKTTSSANNKTWIRIVETR